MVKFGSKLESYVYQPVEATSLAYMSKKAYTSLGTSYMQILLLSAHACMHFAWELQLDTQCVHLVYAYRTNCNQNAYMLEQSTKEFGVRIVAGST